MLLTCRGSNDHQTAHRRRESFHGEPGSLRAWSGSAAAEGFGLTHAFVEGETGKGSDALNRRPQLAAALAEARKKS